MLHFKKMAPRFIIFLLLALFSNAWARNIERDLAADIEAAKLRIGFFDIEVVEMMERISILQIELDLPIKDLTNGIITNLNQIADANATLESFTLFEEEFKVNSRELRRILGNQMRTTLSNIHENLDSNLNQVPINTAVLKREIENADGGYNTMWESMTNHTTDADIAITNAINGQDGQIVVEIYSDWQRVLDILDNERFLTTNVKIVFDARGQDATDSLDAVIAQIP